MLPVPTPAIFLVVVVSWYLYRKRKQTLLSRCNIPSVSANWLLGNSVEAITDHWSFHEKYSRQLGRTYGYYIGTRPQIATTDINLISLVQVKHFEQFFQRAWNQTKGEVRSWPSYENSLVHESVTHKQWKHMRSIMGPSFSAARLKQSIVHINECINTMMKLLEEKTQTNKEIDMYAIAQGLTMDVVGRSACGIVISAQEKPNDPFFVKVREQFDQYIGPEFVPFILALLLPEFEFILYYVRRVEYIILRALDKSPTAYIYRQLTRIIQERLSDENYTGVDALQAMIDGMRNGDKKSDTTDKDVSFTIKHAVTNSNVLLAAGYETTASLIGFLIHILVVYPHVQQKIRREVKEMLQADGEIDYNVMQLPYLDSVVNETLRLFPPLTNFINRKSAIELDYNGMIIPKGATIVVPICQMHRDEEYWPEANTFDPERFMGARKSEIKPLAFQPFGAGPRICPGMRLAELETKIAIAHLLLKYSLDPSPRSKLLLDDVDIDRKQHNSPPKNVFVQLRSLEGNRNLVYDEQ